MSGIGPRPGNGPPYLGECIVRGPAMQNINRYGGFDIPHQHGTTHHPPFHSSSGNRGG